MIGKVLGGIIGAVIAGPWGAVAGAVIGHIHLDSGSSNSPLPEAESADFRESRLLFLEFLCQASAKIARSKGFIDKNDITELEKLFVELKLSPETRTKAIAYFKSSTNNYSLEKIISVFALQFPTKEMRLIMFNVLLRISLADGSMSKEELLQLEKVIEILKLDSKLLNEFRSSYSSGTRGYSYQESSQNYQRYTGSQGSQSSYRGYSSEHATDYAILGIEPNATLDEIKKAYRAKCKELHPDILRSKGIGDYAMKIIEEELRRINEAYSRLTK